MAVAVYAVTKHGASLAHTLSQKLLGSEDCPGSSRGSSRGKTSKEVTLFLPSRLESEYGELACYFPTLSEILGENFHKFSAHLIVGATGMVVRLIAPWLKDKKKDPAVVVLPQDGSFAISLLSGHLGGGNQLAVEVAAITGGQAVISTATDVEGRPAMEMVARKLNLVIEDFSKLPAISRRLVDGDQIPVHDPGLFLTPHLSAWQECFVQSHTQSNQDNQTIQDEPGIWVDYHTGEAPSQALVMHPQIIVLGVGCHRGIDYEELEEFVFSTLARFKLAKGAIFKLATVETRAEEPAILELSRRLERPLVIFTKGELDQVTAPNPSAKVLERIGISSVCEASAMLAAKTDHLEISKQKGSRATLAAALLSQDELRSKI